MVTNINSEFLKIAIVCEDISPGCWGKFQFTTGPKGKEVPDGDIIHGLFTGVTNKPERILRKGETCYARKMPPSNGNHELTPWELIAVGDGLRLSSG